jgi:hypothetical protein
VAADIERAAVMAPTLEERTRMPRVVMSMLPWVNESFTVWSPTSMLPPIEYVVSGVVRPASSSDARVSTFCTDPGS